MYLNVYTTSYIQYAYKYLLYVSNNSEKRFAAYWFWGDFGYMFSVVLFYFIFIFILHEGTILNINLSRTDFRHNKLSRYTSNA